MELFCDDLSDQLDSLYADRIVSSLHSAGYSPGNVIGYMLIAEVGNLQV